MQISLLDMINPERKPLARPVTRADAHNLLVRATGRKQIAVVGGVIRANTDASALMSHVDAVAAKHHDGWTHDRDDPYDDNY